MNDYGDGTNPLGMDLYEEQLDYISKKDSGFDFALDKKKKRRERTGVDDKQKKVREEKPKEEVEIIRKDDPTITTAELITKEFPQDRYTDLNSFKK